MKYNQKLPVKIEKQMDAYIERIKAIKWFQPNKDLDLKKVDKQIKLSVKCFGIEAKIEYRDLKTPNDWDAAWAAARDAARVAAWAAVWAAARDAAWVAAWAAAWDAARDAAKDAAWDAAWVAAWAAAWDAARDAARDAAWDAAWAAAWAAARDAAWDAAWDAARDAARAAADLLALNLTNYRKKYPKGNFINLIPLWEMGLYPVGVIDGKFIVYIPKTDISK